MIPKFPTANHHQLDHDRKVISDAALNHMELIYNHMLESITLTAFVVLYPIGIGVLECWERL
jgi:hypothetical protein